jgi:hypothetical protein
MHFGTLLPQARMHNARQCRNAYPIGTSPSRSSKLFSKLSAAHQLTKYTGEGCPFLPRRIRHPLIGCNALCSSRISNGPRPKMHRLHRRKYRKVLSSQHGPETLLGQGGLCRFYHRTCGYNPIQDPRKSTPFRRPPTLGASRRH